MATMWNLLEGSYKSYAHNVYNTVKGKFLSSIIFYKHKPCIYDLQKTLRKHP